MKWASERRQGEFRGHNAANFALRGGEFLDRTLGRGSRRREQDKTDAVLDCPFSDDTGSKYFSRAEEAGSKIDTLSCDPSSLPSFCFHFLAFPFSLPVGVAKGPKGTQRRRLSAVPSFEGAQTNGRRRSMPKSDKVLPLPAAAPPSPIPPRLNFSRSPTFRSLEEKSQHGEPVHLGSMGQPC